MESQDNCGDSSKGTSTIKRRKISLTRELDEQLEKLAEQEHAGNRSACVRAAISNYQRVCDGKDELAIRQLEQKITEVQNNIERFKEFIDENINKSKRNSVSSSTTEGTDSIQREVYSLISEHDVIEFDEILQQREIAPVTLEEELSCLIERGLITKTSDQNTREYRIRQN